MAVKFSQNIFLCLLISLPNLTYMNFDNDGMFTSSTDLLGLVDTESELVMKLNQYVTEETQRIEKVKKLIRQYEELRDSAQSGEEKFVGNPLNSFLLIKKLTSDWKSLQSLMENTAGQPLLANLTAERESQSLRWPSDEDLNGAAVGLMRLQDTYRYWPLFIYNIYIVWSQTRHRQPGPGYSQWPHLRPRPLCP